MKQPSFFLPHGGGPCFFLNPDGPMPPEWRNMGHFLAHVIADLTERPRAILIISGHWEEPRFTIHAGARPKLLYDYGGFPAHTYDLRWDAPGAPDLAGEAARLLEGAGFPVDTEQDRGWDHGVFIPLKVAVPGADIPTAQLSLRRDLAPAAHIAAGRALAPLREEGVLIVGSGMSFHNMRLRDGSVAGAADDFDEALTAAVTDPDPASRDARLADWESLPHARLAHPREEHLLPLMVAAGAGDTDQGRRVFRDHVIGWTVSGYRFG
jgi:aromatic ring-opening dioxygenase catalytic subunit (LigB family)